MPRIQDHIVPIKPDEAIFILWTGEDKEINVKVSLEIPGTGIDIYGILLGKKQGKLQLNIDIVHKAERTRSNVILKGLLTDETKVTFKGLTKIEKGAKQTNAWLSCYYLLLSPNAKGQAIPSLEILENDVKAGHATTASKPSKKEMFYLQTRGLSEQSAKKLIIEGFIGDILYYMDKDMRRFVRNSMQTYGY